MFSFEFTSDVAKANKRLANMTMRQIPFAASKALNETASVLLRMNKLQMKKTFKNPVAYTLNAFMIERSSKQRLEAAVRLKDKPGGKHYLPIQVKGGNRPRKAVGTAMAERIAYGGVIHAVTPTTREAGGKNGQSIVMSRVHKAMAGVNASYGNTAYTRNAQRKAESKLALAKRPERYFVAEPRSGKAISGGLYRVRGKGKPQKLYHFIQGSVNYKKKLPYKDYMTRYAVKYFPSSLNRQMIAAMRSAKLR